jgi:hypothetical protein
MSLRTQQVCSLGGVILAVTFIIGWAGLAGFVPPISPQKSPAEVVDFFTSNQTKIQIGLFLCLVGSGFLAPFTGVISAQLRRIEGRHTPISYSQLVAGAGVAVGFTMGLMVWYAAAYRPESDPIMTQRLNDLAWFIWVGWAYLPAAQTISVGLAILKDERADPVFPRWVGYLSLWCSLFYLPGGLAIFVTSGPLAWNGLIVWWFLVVAYFIWVVTITWALLYRAIPHQQREEEAAAASATAVVSARVEVPA